MLNKILSSEFSSEFQLWQLFDKKRYNFLSKRDRKKKKISRLHEILLRIQCCHKNVKIARKKINFFPKIFSTKSPFFFYKNTDF